MAERLLHVELTTHFLARLESIETFLSNADAAFAYDALLADLRSTVIPNLARFPFIGRRYLEHIPRSVEALNRLSQLPASTVDALRIYLHGDYLILYTTADDVVYLLSIRHHRQLSFDISSL